MVHGLSPFLKVEVLPASYRAP